MKLMSSANFIIWPRTLQTSEFFLHILMLLTSNKAIYMTASVTCNWAGAVMWGAGSAIYTKNQFHVIGQER